jgi:tetratricopeptide (TPR) repeat protein
MNELTIGLLGALLATNQPQAVSNVLQERTGVTVNLAAAPEEEELRTVMRADEAAQDEVDAWIQAFSAQPQTNQTREASAALKQKIQARFEQVRTAYGRFLQQHPDSAKGFLAYGSFLHDIGEVDSAKIQYENSRQIDPKNPAVWNNLANYYGEFSPVTQAFACYEEAIRLEPNEPVYYQNFGTTVYLFRKDAQEYYHITEPQVFDKALGLYQKALALEPDNLVAATDYAQSYYGIRPLRTNDALIAWTNALNICKDENEREGVQLHLARVKITAGFYEQAQAHLNTVTNQVYADTRRRLERSLTDHRNPQTVVEPEEATHTGSPRTIRDVLASGELRELIKISHSPTNAALATRTNAVINATNPPAVTTNTLPLPATPPQKP